MGDMMTLLTAIQMLSAELQKLDLKPPEMIIVSEDTLMGIKAELKFMSPSMFSTSGVFGYGNVRICDIEFTTARREHYRVMEAVQKSVSSLAARKA